MNVVDTSGWLEYFTDGKNASFFAQAIQDVTHLVVPVICLYEVFKVTLSRLGEEEALRAVGLMSLGKVVDLDREMALEAARLSIQHKLAMADSFILSAAQVCQATLWTQDEHFRSIPGVKYIAKK